MTTLDVAFLDPYRTYLEVLARVHLDGRLRGRVEPADVAQQALVRAIVALPTLRGREPHIVMAWLRRILASTLADTARHFNRDKRDAAREQALEAELDRSALGMASWLAAEQTSPSAAAVRNEELLRLTNALAALSEPFREVVIRKHLQNQTLKDIAADLGKTVPSIASYLRRGLAMLREAMAVEKEP